MIGSGVEDQFSEITTFIVLLQISEARCFNHHRKENFCFLLIITVS